jgi:hypothetical protein
MNPSLDRVVVVGSSCSGKTTFAKRLAATLGHPHIELDALNWLPDWVQRPEEEFGALVGPMDRGWKLWKGAKGSLAQSHKCGLAQLWIPNRNHPGPSQNYPPRLFR